MADQFPFNRGDNEEARNRLLFLTYRSPHRLSRGVPSAELSGFTLLEMVVSLAVVLIIFAASFPLLDRSLARWGMDRFSSEALTAIRTARFHALGQGRRVQIRFNADHESIFFYICSQRGSEGCAAEDWEPFDRIPALRADPARVDLWAIGDDSGGGDPITSGVACLVYSPSGFFNFLTIDQTKDTLDCSGSPGGNAVIITTHAVPTSEKKGRLRTERACDYRTLYFLNGANGRAVLLSYGAYLGAGLFDQYTLGERPKCADESES